MALGSGYGGTYGYDSLLCLATLCIVLLTFMIFGVGRMASYAKWTLLMLLLCGLFTSGLMTPRSKNGDQRQRVLTYTRDMLLAFRDSGVAPPIELIELTDNHLDNNIQQTRQRKRVRKGGARQHLRRKKTSPPSYDFEQCTIPETQDGRTATASQGMLRIS